jgi:hypothetical protein
VRQPATIIFFLSWLCVGPATAAEDYWQKNNCSRTPPEPALEMKGAKGHTFKLVKKRGEALETATIGGDKITIIHFGCDGTGWQIRTRIKDEQNTASGAYDRARKLLKAIEPKAKDEAKFSDVIKVIDDYMAPSRGPPALSERLVAIPGLIETSVSVSTAGQGANTWLTVMIYTGPT